MSSKAQPPGPQRGASTNVTIRLEGGSITLGAGANLGGIQIAAPAASPLHQPNPDQLRAPDPITPYDVFVSYARVDRAFVDGLVMWLERAGLEVWYDRELECGADYMLKINAQLAAARRVLVVLSEAALASEWVRSEAEVARRENKLLAISTKPLALPAPLTLTHAPLLEALPVLGAHEPTLPDTLLEVIANIRAARPG